MAIFKMGLHGFSELMKEMGLQETEISVGKDKTLCVDIYSYAFQCFNTPGHTISDEELCNRLKKRFLDWDIPIILCYDNPNRCSDKCARVSNLTTRRPNFAYMKKQLSMFPSYISSGDGEHLASILADRIVLSADSDCLLWGANFYGKLVGQMPGKVTLKGWSRKQLLSKFLNPTTMEKCLCCLKNDYFSTNIITPSKIKENIVNVARGVYDEHLNERLSRFKQPCKYEIYSEGTKSDDTLDNFFSFIDGVK